MRDLDKGLVRESLEALRAVRAAMADGKITREERRKILRELLDVAKALAGDDEE